MAQQSEITCPNCHSSDIQIECPPGIMIPLDCRDFRGFCETCTFIWKFHYNRDRELCYDGSAIHEYVCGQRIVHVC